MLVDKVLAHSVDSQGNGGPLHLATSLLLVFAAVVTGGACLIFTAIGAYGAETAGRERVAVSVVRHAIGDPNRMGILGAVRDDEIRELCRSLNRELILAGGGEYLTVVSPKEPIPKSFKPWDLTTVTSRDIPVQKEIHLNSEAKGALVSMVKYVNSHRQSNGANYRLIAVSGYRSSSYQALLFERKVNSICSANPGLSRAEAERQAAKVVAPPYESEHALGTTVDFTTGVQMSRGGDILTNAIGDTPEYALMVKEAWRFGWVNSLMSGKEHLTGRMTEQWHWRYVGAPHAEIMWSNGWVPEEYRDYIREQRGIAFKSSTGELYWINYDSATRNVLASVAVGGQRM